MWTAFLIGYFFNETGLGSRISYKLIEKLGRSSLRLGYVAAIADLIIAPATPSNTARTGGLLFPIFQSLAVTLDSRPGPTARRLGSYLMVLMYQISLSTAAMFITAGAINALNLSFAKNILHTEVSWPLWAAAMSIPGLICLALFPYLVYKIYPPEIKEVDNKKIAAEGYKKLGPMSGKEKKLVVLFVLALVGWSTSTITKLDPSAVALAFVAAAILTGIVTWDKVLACKNAWSILIWYAGIVSLANGLSKIGFFTWLGKLLGQKMQFAMGNNNDLSSRRGSAGNCGSLSVCLHHCLYRDHGPAALYPGSRRPIAADAAHSAGGCFLATGQRPDPLQQRLRAHSVRRGIRAPVDVVEDRSHYHLPGNAHLFRSRSYLVEGSGPLVI
jgi:DASS family divalent anion:Na+ symporter